jgi:hypothetical protein
MPESWRRARVSLRAFRRSRKLISSAIISAARSSTFLRSAGLSFRIAPLTFTDMVTSPYNKQIQLNHRRGETIRESGLEVRASACDGNYRRPPDALRARGAPGPDFKLHTLGFL